MEDTQTQSPNDPAPAGITRRSFIRRTTGTAVAVALALHCFRAEVLATEAGGSSKEYELQYQGGHTSPTGELHTWTDAVNHQWKITYAITCAPPGENETGPSLTASATITITVTDITANKSYGGGSATGTVVKTLLNSKDPSSISYSGSTGSNSTTTVAGQQITVVATPGGDSVVLEAQVPGKGKNVTIQFSMPVVEKPPQ